MGIKIWIRVLMKKILLSCTDFTYQIGYRTLFRKAGFALFSEEILLLTGENGAGKSSLLRYLYSHFREKMFQTEKNLRISYLGHETGLYSSLSLFENLQYFSGLGGHDPDLQKAEFLLEGFSLKKRLHDPVFSFSEGMKKKSGLCRLFLQNAELYLLDEPFNALDKKSYDFLEKIILEKKKTAGVVLVSHDERVRHIADRELRIEKENLVEV